jgi:hypothetical protein
MFVNTIIHTIDYLRICNKYQTRTYQAKINILNMHPSFLPCIYIITILNNFIHRFPRDKRQIPQYTKHNQTTQKTRKKIDEAGQQSIPGTNQIPYIIND